MMRKKLLLLTFVTLLLSFMSGPMSAQTFWGVTSQGTTFMGGTIFSYNVQTNSCRVFISVFVIGHLLTV